MSGFKTAGQKIAGSPFFTFSRLPMEFIEKKKIFGLVFIFVCIVMAVVTLAYPFVLLGRVISSGYFNFGLKYALAFIFTWLAVAAACWLGFHLWWKRRKKAGEFGTSEFIMIPFLSEMIKTFGEWAGILYGVVGAVGGLFALIFLGKYSGGMLSAVLLHGNSGRDGGLLEDLPLVSDLFGGLRNVKDELLPNILNGAVIIGPVVGILIILLSRFIAERLLVLAAIANNTKKNIPQT